MEGPVSNDPRFTYHRHLAEVAADDVATVVPKDHQYGASWKLRGGVGAFMMLARKWDRLNNAMDPLTNPTGDQREAPLSAYVGNPIPAYDILTAGVLDTRAEGILDDIADLRRYLLLLECEIREQRNPLGRLVAKQAEAPRPMGVDHRRRHTDRSTAPGELS